MQRTLPSATPADAAMRATFERALVVNLPEREDRRRETRRDLGKLGLRVGDREFVEFHPATRPPDDGGFPSLGAHGCFLSHLSILRRARDEGWKNVLIFEDDVRPVGNAAAAMPALCEQLGGVEWDIALLGWVRHFEHGEGGIDPYDGEPYWQPWSGPFVGTHAYAVNGPSLAKVISLFEPHGIGPGRGPDGRRWHLDELFWVVERETDLKLVAAKPVLFGQRASVSDVGEPGRFDRNPITRPLMKLARAVRNTLRN